MKENNINNRKNYLVISAIVLIVLFIMLLIYSENYTKKDNTDIETISLIINESSLIDISKYKEEITNFVVENSEIIKINDNGEVIALKKGSSKVTLKNKDGKVIEELIIVVLEYKDNLESETPEREEIEEKKEITKLEFLNKEENIIVGNSKQLLLIVTPLDVIDENIKYESKDTNIVVINDKGIIKGINVGSTTITATAPNGIMTSIEVTVVTDKIEITKITAKIKNKQINPCEKTMVFYEIEPQNSTENIVTWKSSDTSVASVDGKGIVTGNKLGKATITLTTKNGMTSSVMVEVKYNDATPPIVAPTVEVRENSLDGLIKSTVKESVNNERTVVYTNAENLYIKLSGGKDNDGGSGIEKYAYSHTIDGKKIHVSNSRISIKLSGNERKSYYIFVRDKAGNYSKVYREVVIVSDKIAPNSSPLLVLRENDINGRIIDKGISTTKSQSIVMYTNVKRSYIEIIGTDLESGVSGYAYSLPKEGGGPKEEKIDIGNTGIPIDFSNNITALYIYTKDNAGNYSKVYTRVLIKLDQTKPICNWTGESTNWTRENRKITLTCSDTISGCDPSSSIFTKEFSSSVSVTTLSYTIKDKAGNSTLCSKKVSVLVDKAVPSKTPTIKLFTNNSSGSVMGLAESDSKSKAIIMYTNVVKSYIKLTGGKDSGSGVAGYAYATELGGAKIDINNNEIYFDAPSTGWKEYYIYTKDRVGRYSKVYTKILVRYINKIYLYDDSRDTIIDDLANLMNKNYTRKQKFAFSLYNTNDQNYLSSYLENKVNLAGYSSREGVVAAARFLSVQLNNRVQYISNVGNHSKGISYSNKTVVYPKVRYEGNIYENNSNYDRSFGPYSFNVSAWNTCIINNKGKSIRSDGSDCSNYKPPANLKENYNLPSDTIAGNEVGGMQCSGMVNWVLQNGGYDFIKDLSTKNSNDKSSKGQAIIDNYGSAISQGSIYKNDILSANYLCNYIEDSVVYAKNIASRLSSSKCSDEECSGAYTSYKYAGLRYALENGSRILDRSLLTNDIMQSYYGENIPTKLYNNKSPLGTVNLPKSVFLGKNSWTTIAKIVKPGDLICRTVGHVGIIIDMDDKYYYVAHQVHWGANGTQLMKVSKSTLIGERWYKSNGNIDEYQWESIVSMENVYKNEKYKK